MINAYIFTSMFMVSQERLTVTPVKQPQDACYGRAKDDNLKGLPREGTFKFLCWCNFPERTTKETLVFFYF